MKIAIVEQNREAIEDVLAIANGEHQVNTVHASTVFEAASIAEMYLEANGIPDAIREGAKAQHIEGEVGQPTTYFNMERGGDGWFLVSADRTHWHWNRQGTKLYDPTEQQLRVAIENGFNRLIQAAEEDCARNNPEPSSPRP